MNFILIPFFLAANVVVNDTVPASTWIHGPEYTYEVRFLVRIPEDAKLESGKSFELSSGLKCRPKSPESLVCRLEKIVAQESKGGEPEEVEIPELFEVKFNEHGVESLRLREPVKIKKLNLIRHVVAQLSVGVDLRQRANSLPTFVAKENFTMGECATFFWVSIYNAAENRSSSAARKGWKFDLVALSIPGRRPGLKVLVEKIRKRDACIAPENLLGAPRKEESFKVLKSHSRMRFTDADVFESNTEIYVKTSNNVGGKVSVSWISVNLTLRSIDPAKENLGADPFSETTSIFINDEMEHNFIL
ncbi:hypothetical protein KM043_000683 [Ampulex compressa]|nr:hypothetical protein KM043_000683 [Ampulex compressa]